LRVLLVEDEPEMAAALAVALKNYDMIVDHVSTLADARRPFSSMTMARSCSIASYPMATD
jgi:DNA-binding response OmpR family regulator